MPKVFVSEVKETIETSFFSEGYKLDALLAIPSKIRGAIVFIHGKTARTKAFYTKEWDILVKAGFICMAWDKPNMHNFQGPPSEKADIDQNWNIHVYNAVDAIDYIKCEFNLPEDRIGMWGISQAGYVMPNVYKKRNGLGFITALSCSGQDYWSDAYRLNRLNLERMGFSQMEKEMLLKAFLKGKDVVINRGTYSALYKAWEPFVTIVGEEPEPEESFNEFVSSQAFSYNPMNDIAGISCPVQALWGDQDVSIDPFVGLEIYESVLRPKLGNLLTTHMFEGYDHNLGLPDNRDEIFGMQAEWLCRLLDKGDL